MDTPSHSLASCSLESLRSFYAGIADTLWCLDLFADAEGRRCALGHLCQWTGHRSEEGYPILQRTTDVDWAEEAFAPLRVTLPEKVSAKSGLHHRDEVHVVACVANGAHPLYQQETPRLRTLAAIDDLILMRDAVSA